MKSRGRGRHGEREIDTFVLLFVREGTLHMEEAGREFTVGAGQSLLLWPQRHHKGLADYPEDLQFFWLHFDLAPPQGATQVESDGNNVDSTAVLLNVPQYTTVARPDFVTELFRRYLDDQESGRLQPLSASLLVWLILCEIADARPALEARASTSLAGRAYAHLRTHFHERITAHHVARALGCNPQYLSRAYQQTYGQTLTATLRRMRLHHARSLLLHSNANVSEIARQCGFEDVAYFHRVFKAHEGMTPLNFRLLHARLKVNTE